MGPNNPIENVVILVKENHTFDNYFGTFPGANGASLAAAKDPPTGGDPRHDHVAWLERATGAVKQQYSESDIPAYFAYARQYTLCDNYFTEVASQSEPNHLMLIAAASPIIDNESKSRTYQPSSPYDLASLPQSLETVGLTWKTYGDPSFTYFSKIKALQGSKNILPWTQLDTDAAAGKLPNVCWVYAPGSPTDLSEHPPDPPNAKQQTVKLGAEWTAARVTNLGNSPQWPKMAIFITWDDWGGWYDHVAPAPVAYPQGAYQLGFRVPLLVVSPYTAPHFVGNQRYDFGSIIRYIEHNFGISEGALGFADARSRTDLTPFFNLNYLPRVFLTITAGKDADFFVHDQSPQTEPDDD